MMLRVRVMCLAVIFLFLSSSILYAGRLFVPRKARQPRLVKRQTSNEAVKETVKTSSWKNKNMKVSNRSERRFDKNRDGYLQPSESRRLLSDRYNKIKRWDPDFKRSVKVSNSIESEFDFNKDGYLQKDELIAIGKER